MPAEVLAAFERGWSLIPCGSDKRPLVRRWKPFQDERPTLAQLERWNSELHPATWAVITGSLSGVVVVDADGDAGIATLERLGLRDRAQVRTGSGGLHLYARHPGRDVPTLNGRSKRQLGRQFPGLDVRGDGGYAIFHGSNGAGPYAALRKLEPEPAEVLAPVLEALVELDAHAGQSALPTAEQLLERALEQARHGNRNDVGLWLACQLRDNGHDQATSQTSMRAYAARVPQPEGEGEPYTLDEARATLRSAYGRPARDAWGENTPDGAESRPPRPGFKLKWREITKGVNKGKHEIVLPPLPAPDDDDGACEWALAVFNYDPQHPFVGGEWAGPHGTNKTAILRRAGAPELRFSPYTRVNSAPKLIEALSACAIRTDGVTPPIKGEHCPEISTVVRRLCDRTAAQCTKDRAEAIVRTFMQEAEAVHGHTTHGRLTTGQRYEAAFALQRPKDEFNRPLTPPRYLVDGNTGELVIRTSELQAAARAYNGPSLKNGEFEELMAEIRWSRITIDGNRLPGRAGKKGPHAVAQCWRGLLAAPATEYAGDSDDDVTK